MIQKDQIVNYVAPPEKEGAKPKIRKAKVIESMPPGAARLDIAPDGNFDGSHTALALFSADRETPNSFHPSDENGATGPAAPAKTATKETKTTQ
jgi:hypothetical protein